jgi:predicted ester cyclase
MTAQDNLSTAMNLIDSLNAHDMSVWASKLAPGFAADYPGGSGLNAQGARLFNESFFPAFSDLRFEVQRTLVAGDSVIIEWRAGGTHDGPLTSPTGQTIPPTYRKGAIAGVLVADVKDGQITRERTYWDQMELLGQLGLIPA